MANKIKIEKRKLKNIIKLLDYDFKLFDIESFISVIEAKFERRICLIEIDLPDSIQGIWVSDEEAPIEYVFYEKTLSLVHKLHVQLHELSHYLCGHPTAKVNRAGIADIISNSDKSSLKNISYELVRYRKSEVESQELYEMEAEYLTNMLVSKLIKTEQFSRLARSTQNDKVFKTIGMD